MRYLAITYPLALLIWVIAFVNSVRWHEESIYEFEQRQMDLQVNYAIDAASQEMLYQSVDIDTDYAEWGKMSIEPMVAYDTYIALMLRNYGWADTPENRQALDELVPFFTVCAYDGFYIYSAQKIEDNPIISDWIKYPDDTYGFNKDTSGNPVGNTTYGKVWSMKIPYAEYYNDGSGGAYWAYFLGGERGTRWKTANGFVEANLELNADQRSRAKTCIARTIMHACNNALIASSAQESGFEIYLPAAFTELTGTNAITRPSCLTYLAREDLATRWSVITFGIGGSKIDEASFCICYELTIGGVTQKLYAPAKYRSSILARYGSSCRIVYVAESAEIAAQHGYYYDLNYLD